MHALNRHDHLGRGNVQGEHQAHEPCQHHDRNGQPNAQIAHEQIAEHPTNAPPSATAGGQCLWVRGKGQQMKHARRCHQYQKCTNNAPTRWIGGLGITLLSLHGDTHQPPTGGGSHHRYKHDGSADQPAYLLVPPRQQGTLLLRNQCTCRQQGEHKQEHRPENRVEHPRKVRPLELTLAALLARGRAPTGLALALGLGFASARFGFALLACGFRWHDSIDSVG